MKSSVSTCDNEGIAKWTDSFAFRSIVHTKSKPKGSLWGSVEQRHSLAPVVCVCVCVYAMHALEHICVNVIQRTVAFPIGDGKISFAKTQTKDTAPVVLLTGKSSFEAEN